MSGLSSRLRKRSCQMGLVERHWKGHSMNGSMSMQCTCLECADSFAGLLNQVDSLKHRSHFTQGMVKFFVQNTRFQFLKTNLLTY